MQFQNMLRDQIEAEQLCRRRLLEFSESPYITGKERTALIEQAAEEVEHEIEFKTLLARYGVLPPRSYEGPLAFTERTYDSSVEVTLRVADFRATERLMGPTLKSAREIFAQAGDAEAVAVYDKVIADEKVHGQLTQGILKRLMKHPVIGATLKARYLEKLGWTKHLFRAYRTASEG